MSKSRLTPEQRQRRKKRILIGVAVLLVAALCLALYLGKLRQDVDEKFGSDSSDEAEMAYVTRGTIQTTVSGSGQLADRDSETVDLPALLMLDKLYVEEGDDVEEGQLLAAVNPQTLMAAMAQTQTELDEIDGKIDDADDEKADTAVKASVSGRVKEIFVEAGDNVSAAMYEHGALILLSLDGCMAVDIQSDIAAGESVVVKAADGREWEGTVDHSADGTATVLLTDDGPLNGQSVTVTDKEGKKLGSGSLYIHQSLAVTGYVGTVSGVSVSENQRVSSGSTLLRLSDTGYSANYEALLKEREDLREKMNDLIAIYSMGGIYAPMSGRVVSVEWEEDAEQSQTDTELLSIRANDTIILNVNVDESDILNVSEGLEAAVTVSSIGDETYKAIVTEVGTEGTAAGGVTTYTVKLEMDRAEQMRSGMSATADISISAAADALILPEDAVNRTSDRYYVYTAIDEATGELSGMKEVTIGVNGGGYTEILSGVEEGELVYYIPPKEYFDFSMFFGGGGFGGPGGSGYEYDMSDFEGYEMPMPEDFPYGRSDG